jgi:multidrug efflux pump subunit AcrA (membrane-fusion protein)
LPNEKPVDLSRLKIPDGQCAPRGGGLKTAIACLICLGLGFGASSLLRQVRSSGKLKVTTAVARPASGGSGKSFTAGGWIEVAVPAYPVVISARVSERLEELLVREGQTVKAGQLLARQYDKDIRSRRDLASAAHESATKKLAKMKAGFRKEDVSAAAARLLEAAEKLRLAKATYKRSAGLKPGAISAEELDRDLSAFKRAEADHARAAAELDKMKAGYRPEDVAVAAAELAEAAARLELAERSLAYCRVTAPDAAPELRVLKTHRRVGEWVPAGKEGALVSLYDPRDIQVRLDVIQSNIRAVRVGGPVSVRTEVNPDREYRGKVLRVEPLAELSKNTVTVRVKIEDPDDALFPEMVAQATFAAGGTGGDGPSGLLVPEAAVRGEGKETCVFVVIDGIARRRKVKVAEKRGGRAVIGSGLSSGQQVVVGGPADLADGQEVEEEQ